MTRQPVSRRTVLVGVAGAGLAGAATAGGLLALQGRATSRSGRVTATSAAVRERERFRRARGTGRRVAARLVAGPAEVDLGGRTVPTWAYNGQVPGPPIHCAAGDRLEVEVVNRLPEPTTVHWHGLRLRNDMDGVPQLTQQPIAPGERMRYAFTTPDPGTYWLHPHVGLQRERGLFSPLIVDDPREPGDYDAEFVVVLDDWIDGAGTTPDGVLAALRKGGLESRYETPVEIGQIPDESRSWEYHVPDKLANPPARAEPGAPVPVRLASSVDFPFYPVNGRTADAPETFRAKPGQRVRIRLINAAGATVFRVALGGHRLTVTHTDGFPVEPVTVDTLQVASGERYDLRVSLDDGVFPLVAVAEGKNAQGLALLRTGGGRAPISPVLPDELAGRLLKLNDLRADSSVRVHDDAPDVTHRAYLTGDMTEFAWRINAETYHPDRPFAGLTPLPVRHGQRVRIVAVNQTPMYHPMHLHGHTDPPH